MKNDTDNLGQEEKGETMKDYTVVARNGWMTVNGHPVRMTRTQAVAAAKKMLRDFPESKAEIFRLTDEQMVGMAYEWGTMTESMEGALCR